MNSIPFQPISPKHNPFPPPPYKSSPPHHPLTPQPIQMEIPYTLLLLLSLSFSASAQLRVGFYSTTCPRAETIVRNTVQSHLRNDFTIAPALLRMHFHDCFVHGCDASILLNGTSSEKTASPNLGVRGYQVIDDAKSLLETACPRTVSCADILTLAARDSVLLTRGVGWPVPTGRKDGNVSLASDVDLPGPRDSIEVQKQKFADKGLTPQDMVALVGGHTIGTTACLFFSYRLYNFSGKNDTDPSMDPAFARKLKGLCPQNGDGSNRVALDDGSERVFDTSFFRNIRNGKGVLESDQKLWSDVSTQVFAKDLLGPKFFTEFARAMVKMSKVEVKTTNSEGEIRRVCSVVN